MRKRNNVVPIRFSDHELSVIDANAEKARMSRTEYLVSAGMDKPIVILDDLKPMLAELRRIGNNINQLPRKANSGEIYAIGLTEINEQLGAITAGLCALQKEVDRLRSGRRPRRGSGRLQQQQQLRYEAHMTETEV